MVYPYHRILSGNKKNEALMHATMQMNVRNVTLSERCWSHMTAYLRFRLYEIHNRSKSIGLGSSVLGLGEGLAAWVNEG